MIKVLLVLIVIFCSLPCFSEGQALLETEINKILNKKKNAKFSGVVFVSVNGQKIVNLGIGLSDIDGNIPLLVPSFSQKLAVALANRGYKNIVVGGYTGATAGNNTVINLKPDGQLNLLGAARALHIQWYNHSGM